MVQKTPKTHGWCYFPLSLYLSSFSLMMLIGLSTPLSRSLSLSTLGTQIMVGEMFGIADKKIGLCF